MFTAFLFRKAEIQWWGYYAIVCGGMCWIGLLFAGVHPALALVSRPTQAIPTHSLNPGASLSEYA